MITDTAADVFKHYRVLRRPDGRLWELGRGAMGVTYKAEDTSLHAVVALKVVNALYLHTEADRIRFRREARAAAAVRHPNVATVYHLSDDDQSFFYAMEFVEGETLADFVARHGPVDAAMGLNIAGQIASALCAAARQSLIHRDIKPANVMLVESDGHDDDEYRQVKLIDFGLAKSTLAPDASGSNGRVTLSGFVGTAQYASPEQLEELPLDGRTDIYSLGITLWFLLTGRPPFVGPLISVFSQQLGRPPPFELLDAAGVPPEVRALLGRMLEKKPEDRLSSAMELRREIAACARAIAPSRPVPLTEPATQSAVPVPQPPPTATEQTTLVPPPDPAPPADPAMATTLVPAIVLAADTLLLTPDDPTTLLPPPPFQDDDVMASVDVPAAPVVPGVGDTLDGIFQLQEELDGGDFTALDLRASPPRPGRVRFLPDDDASWEASCEQWARLQAAPHEGLVEVLGYGTDQGVRYVVTESLTGFSLVDLLRARQAIPPAEALRLAARAAEAADHACLHELPALNFDPYTLTVHFPGGQSISPHDPSEDWPDFQLKGMCVEAAAGGTAQTWMGTSTLLPSSGEADGRCPVTGVARLIYELVGGKPAAFAWKYIALSAFNEAANNLLRSTLRADSGVFRDGREFVAALERASVNHKPGASPAARPEPMAEPEAALDAVVVPSLAEVLALPPVEIAPPAVAEIAVVKDPALGYGHPLTVSMVTPAPVPTIRLRARLRLSSATKRVSTTAAIFLIAAVSVQQGLRHPAESAPAVRAAAPTPPALIDASHATVAPAVVVLDATPSDPPPAREDTPPATGAPNVVPLASVTVHPSPPLDTPPPRRSEVASTPPVVAASRSFSTPRPTPMTRPEPKGSRMPRPVATPAAPVIAAVRARKPKEHAPETVNASTPSVRKASPPSRSVSFPPVASSHAVRSAPTVPTPRPSMLIPGSPF